MMDIRNSASLSTNARSSSSNSRSLQIIQDEYDQLLRTTRIKIYRIGIIESEAFITSMAPETWTDFQFRRKRHERHRRCGWPCISQIPTDRTVRYCYDVMPCLRFNIYASRPTAAFRRNDVNMML